jgi:hypothetical protein
MPGGLAGAKIQQTKVPRNDFSCCSRLIRFLLQKIKKIDAIV